MNEDRKKLRGWEMWVADHAGPIFAAVALAIIVGAIAIFVVFLQAGDAQNQVDVLKPQVTRVNRAICDAQSLDHPHRAEHCAERIRVGLVNCRRSTACRAAFLAVATSPGSARSTSPAPGDTEGGDAPQQPPNHGSQQPSPGSQPGHSGQEAAPTPSPASPGPAAPAPSPAPETPASGSQGASGADVEVCALKTCVGAEVGLGL